MNCKNCGNEMEANSKFCTSCGTSQEEGGMGAVDFSGAPVQEAQGEVEFGKGAKVWFILSIVGLVAAVLLNISQGIFLMTPFAAIGIAAYVWLMMSRRKLAFFVIVANVAVIALINLLVYRLGASSFSGFLNPLITFLVIKSHWQRMKM